MRSVERKIQKKLRPMTVLDMVADKKGGMEEYLILLSQILKSRGADSIIVLRDCKADIKVELENAGATVLCGPLNGSIGERLFFLFGLVKTYKPNLIIFNFLPVLDFAANGIRFMTGCPCIVVDHFSGTGRFHNSFSATFAKILYKISSYFCAKYVAVSRFVENRLVVNCFINPNKVAMVYNGVRHATPQEVKQASLERNALGIEPEQTVILTVAYLLKEKGIHVLIDAAARLESKFPNLVFLVAGDGPEREALKLQAKGLKNFRFLGKRTDIQVLQNLADIVTIPSIWAEAFGFTVAEAMANGRAVVASSVGGIPELIENGNDGLLIAPQDSVALANALESLLLNPERRLAMGRAAAHSAKNKFGLERMVLEMISLFDSVI